ncbi:transcriptional regulator, partial [Bacillus cereus]|nr:transcriptional regulator [Bacillus cereus]
TLSHPVKVFRESGVMYTRLEGTQRFISLRAEDLNARFPGLLQVVLHATEPY